MQTIDKNIQHQIMKLTGLSDQQYTQLIYDCGLAYLAKLAPEYPQVCTQIAKSEIFWNWWKGHWELRDKEFIEICQDWDEGQDARLEVFKNHHDPLTLSAAIYLNGQVLQDSYAEMISKLTNQQAYAH